MSCVLFYVLKNMPVYHKKKDISTVPKKKIYSKKYVGLIKNPFLNAHVNVHRVKIFLLNNVWLLLSMLNSSFLLKLVFTVTMQVIS
ncbi:hypothetical protein AB205_0090950 [Aquarana catesbeiana]|uniref:Uncharacterized protein n=1 Tax=Aquarana catesbeiana TaxID=8400 RepID=A0A2G9RJI4_AQUCT|nr:hypothetical protein AB205_0090950 [Aquarana catesbeiana]